MVQAAVEPKKSGSRGHPKLHFGVNVIRSQQEVADCLMEEELRDKRNK